MYFGRFLVVATTLASLCAVQASSSSLETNLVVPDTQRQAPFGVTQPSAAVVTQHPKTNVALATKTRRGGGATSQEGAVILGLILALNSGFINGCCLSGAISATGAKQAVAAVTASWTNSALGMASGDMKQFRFLAKIIASFVGGSVIAGFLNPNPALFKVARSAYAMPLAVGCVLLVAASQLIQNSDTVKLAFMLCAIANGIQNSVTSTLTGNLCRTSHYTGISSDMGTFIGQILGGNKANVYKLKVFMGLAACFWAGGYMSYTIGKEFGATSLLFAAGLYAVIIAAYDSFAKTL